MKGFEVPSMCWREPAILSLVSETVVTKFASGVGRPKKRCGSILLWPYPRRTLVWPLRQLSGEWSFNEQYKYKWLLPFLAFSLKALTERLHLRRPDSGVNFFQHFAQIITKLPGRIMLLEFPHIADPPNMVANAVCLFVAPF